MVFPFELKVVNTTPDCPDADTPYDLFGVVVHMGAQPNHGGSAFNSMREMGSGVGSGVCGVTTKFLRAGWNMLSMHNPPATLHEGHYVALVKSCGQWVCFDDDQVIAVTEAQVGD